jgi:hypothetical protein
MNKSDKKTKELSPAKINPAKTKLNKPLPFDDGSKKIKKDIKK